jgi:hypothetical protein
MLLQWPSSSAPRLVLRQLAALLVQAVLVFQTGCTGVEPTQPPQRHVTSLRVDAVPPNVVGNGVGETLQLAATAYDDAGTVISNPGPITWSSSDSLVATVNPSGVVRGLKPGSPWIRAVLVLPDAVLADSIRVAFGVLVDIGSGFH